MSPWSVCAGATDATTTEGELDRFADLGGTVDETQKDEEQQQHDGNVATVPETSYWSAQLLYRASQAVASTAQYTACM